MKNHLQSQLKYQSIDLFVHFEVFQRKFLPFHFHKQYKNIDVLVDGEFQEDKKNIMLEFRGSENQRIIDVKKTLEAGEIVLLEV